MFCNWLYKTCVISLSAKGEAHMLYVSAPLQGHTRVESLAVVKDQCVCVNMRTSVCLRVPVYVCVYA